jgi:hypothetical protein
MQRFFSGASQNRDRQKYRALYGPGSAAHRFAKSYALRRVRGTEKKKAARFAPNGLSCPTAAPH